MFRKIKNESKKCYECQTAKGPNLHTLSLIHICVKQHTAVNNACDAEKEQHSERNVCDTKGGLAWPNLKKNFSKPYDRTVSTMQRKEKREGSCSVGSKREIADEEIKVRQQQVHVQPSCSRDTTQ